MTTVLLGTRKLMDDAKQQQSMSIKIKRKLWKIIPIIRFILYTINLGFSIKYRHTLHKMIAKMAFILLIFTFITVLLLVWIAPHRSRITWISVALLIYHLLAWILISLTKTSQKQKKSVAVWWFRFSVILWILSVILLVSLIWYGYYEITTYYRKSDTTKFNFGYPLAIFT